MLGVSGLMGSSGGDGAAAAAAAEPHESGGASGGSSEVGASSSMIPAAEDSHERSGGNRWPRQETLALLKIRSDMDVAFRDASLKGPLWEEVSRKMAELGFQRSAKKCKEKFENVYKYHKRTKDGRASKSDGKTYRFFDQLEALENAPPPPFTPPPPRPPSTAAPPMPTNATNLPLMPSHITVSSTSPNPVSVAPPAQTANNPINASALFHPSQLPQLQPPPPAAVNASNPPQTQPFQTSHPHLSLMSNSTSTSSTSSDEDIQRRRGRKRKWKDFFQRLMKDVIHKQEELQKKFLDTLEKRERERMAREEAWRVQEMARMNREHELLVQRRSIAAAKDAAVIAFLQKVTEQHNLQIPIGNSTTAPPQVPMQVQPPENPQPLWQPPPPPPPQQSTLPPPAAAPGQIVTVTPTKALETSKTDNGGDTSVSASSSRWPKAEVQALINLRTSLDLKYQENGPKGPLWEEISAAMAKLGYNRSSKRCKEKWENINKYFKKVKESNKKRPEDSKTCPYFYQLDAIYKERPRMMWARSIR
ncbi:UNVERIFIED_CONTAM: Trihelix transcription factor GT-2 [Sesamum radiatum]|uniref:Trihelix transcription factor GT-2 n=1 Tax=Sesamum radiatum TaxID=300843 RepID=A0AAW2SH71_SESRA